MLSKDGYAVKKKNLTEKQIKKLKDDLTVTPKSTDFNENPRKFKVYSSDEENYYLPRYYGIKEFGQPLKNELYRGRKIDIKFKGEMRDYQIPIANLIQDTFKKTGGGIISLPCGRGKTIIAINAIVRLGVKTLVIGHKEFLIKQWRRQIAKFTNASIGLIQRDVVDIKNRDIVLGMLKSLSIKDYKKEVFEEFGLVIVDECHHIAAEVYSRALPKIASMYNLGLSATPKRTDGLSKIFYWYMGDQIYKEDIKENKNVIAKVYKFKCLHPLFKNIIIYFNKNPNKEKMATNLTLIPERNELIMDKINERRTRGDYSKILILSSRREHLKRLKIMTINEIRKDKKRLNLFINMKKNFEKELNEISEDETIKIMNQEIVIKGEQPDKKYILEQIEWLDRQIEIYEKRAYQKTGYYMGGMKEDQLNESEDKDIIFGTFAMAEEGLDIPNLNTIVLATPKPNVVQSVGRILRLEHYEISPEVIDIHDQLSMFTNFGGTRERYYRKCLYHIHDYEVNINYDINAKPIKKIIPYKSITTREIKYQNPDNYEKEKFVKVTKKDLVKFIDSDSD